MRAFGFFVAFLVGVFISTSYFYIRESSNKNSFVPVEIPVPSGITAKLQVLTDSEIADYYKLQDEHARYLKADEILSKIVVIFLGDLGVHVNPQITEQAKAHLGKK